jgi:hypothetical protein
MLARVQRREFVILGTIVAALVALALWGLARGTMDFGPSGSETIAILPLFSIPFAVIAAFWPLGVWRRDGPEERGYFWSLPVPRGPHTLLRVGMGWVLLMLACLAILAVALGLLVVAQARFDGLHVSLLRWYVPLATATLAYLLVSFLAVLVDGPVRVVVWASVAVIGLRIVAEATDMAPLASVIDTLVQSLSGALLGPVGSAEVEPEIIVDGAPFVVAVRVWATHYLLWFVVGTAALLVSAFSHRDAR